MYNSKSIKEIDPATLPNINIVGVGAVGSKVADLLGRLGIEANLYDFDIVEEKNIGNQLFWPKNIGELKVDATVDVVKESTGVTHTPFNESVSGKLNGLTFLLIDTVKGRKEIIEANKLNFGCDWMIETRMGLHEGRIYSFDPKNPVHFKEINATLNFSDDDEKDDPSLVSACGIRTDLASASHIIAGLAVQALLYWNSHKNKTCEDPIVNEQVFAFQNGLQIAYTNIW